VRRLEGEADGGAPLCGSRGLAMRKASGRGSSCPAAANEVHCKSPENMIQRGGDLLGTTRRRCGVSRVGRAGTTEADGCDCWDGSR
jgi:hypothetical protein